MKSKIVTGVYSALVSPIDSRGRVRLDVARALCDWQIDRGIDGFYLTGATGEGCAMAEEERMRLVEAVISHVNGRVPCVAHVAASNWQSARRLALQAERAGARALSATPPPATAYSPQELYEYYQALSGVTDLPFLVYAQSLFPQKDIVPFMEKLLENERIAGLKYTRQSYYELGRLTALRGGDVNVINGPDETLLCGLVMGADGGIGSTYNVMPAQFKQLYLAYRRGDLAEARRLQFAINRVIEVILRHGVIPTVKYIIALLGFEAGEAEMPARRFGAEEKAAIQSELRAAGYFEMAEGTPQGRQI